MYSGSVSDCYNTGQVSYKYKHYSCGSFNFYIGGVAGYMNGNVSDCYNIGEVSSFSDIYVYSCPYTDGVVGAVPGSMSNCYNTGEVSSSDHFYSSEDGGVAGGVYISGSVSSCCYIMDNTISAKKAIGEGKVGENVVGLTMEQMTGSDALK